MERNMLSLPSVFALRGTNEHGKEFMACITEGTREGYLECCISDIFDPRAKFSVERGPADCVHIRSCYNNKYWIRRSETEACIIPAATEPNQDEEAWNCTLFQAHISTENSNDTEVLTVMFTHKQTGGLLTETYFADGWVLSIDSPSQCPYSWRIFDLGSLMKIPRYVAFKEKKYGKFLAPYTWELANICPHGFIATDVSDPRIVYQVFPTSEGRISIKNTWSGKFWVLRDKAFLRLLGISPSTSNFNDASEIEVVKVGDETGIVALRNPENKRFYGRKTIIGTGVLFGLSVLPHALYPVGTTLEARTRLEIVDPVLRRRINRVEYRVEHARIYGRIPITVFEAQVQNSSYQECQFHTAEVKYVKTRTSQWNNCVTLSSSFKKSFNTCFNSAMPFMIDSKFKVSVSTTSENEYAWGESIENTEQVKSIYTVTIPPRQNATITVKGIKAKSEIPFSYVQVDTFYDQSEKIDRYHDGVYHGIDTPFSNLFDPMKSYGTFLLIIIQ